MTPSFRRPVALIILDGWGIAQDTTCSAVDCANVPCYHELMAERPHSILRADGEAVGLMPGQMGDSNVGHLNIGAGRIVFQDLPRIFNSIEDKSFFQNEALSLAMSDAKKRGGALHLMGLLSDGGVHSHIKHVDALLEMASQNGLANVYVHCFLDGRDVPPKSALTYVEHLEQSIKRIGIGRIATIQGRYWAMDRDKRWERVQQAYDAMVGGQGLYFATAYEAVSEAYARGETDEFIKPSIISSDSSHAHTVKAGDSMIFFNYRADRAREITRAFINESLPELRRPSGLIPVTYVGMAQYDATFDIPVAFPPLHIENTLGEWLSKNGVRQLRLAETEKYAHVTFFMNGMREDPYQFEDRILIPSPKVATYDLMPEMSAEKVTDIAVEKILSGEYDCLIMNYANPDMVGHTGNMEAAVKAVQVVDAGLRKVISAILSVHGAALIISDHGNVERMKGAEGEPYTAHTSNSVPCILVDDQRKSVQLRNGILADVAPTLLEVLGLEQPKEMDRRSLIIH